MKRYSIFENGIKNVVQNGFRAAMSESDALPSASGEVTVYAETRRVSMGFLVRLPFASFTN